MILLMIEIINIWTIKINVRVNRKQLDFSVYLLFTYFHISNLI